MGHRRDLGTWLSGIIGGARGVMGYWRDLGIWLSGIGSGGGHGILQGPGDLAVGYRRWGGVMGYWRDLEKLGGVHDSGLGK